MMFYEIVTILIVTIVTGSRDGLYIKVAAGGFRPQPFNKLWITGTLSLKSLSGGSSAALDDP